MNILQFFVMLLIVSLNGISAQTVRVRGNHFGDHDSYESTKSLLDLPSSHIFPFVFLLKNIYYLTIIINILTCIDDL